MTATSRETKQGQLVIRADANVAMGTGHIMRCLALAQAWQDRGGICCFVCAEIPGGLERRLRSEGIEIERIDELPGSEQDSKKLAEIAAPRKAEWIVVDGYQFDGNCQKTIKESGLGLLVLDDYGRAGPYCADVVLNQNYHAAEPLYSAREKYTKLLLGPRFTLLRREFSRWQNWRRTIPFRATRVLVSMGGSDPEGLTLKVTQALRSISPQGFEITVVFGPGNPTCAALRDIAAEYPSNFHWHANVTDMSCLMAEADIAVMASGGTIWELLYMGCPLLVYVRNPEEEKMISVLENTGVLRGLGYAHKFESCTLANEFSRLSESAEDRERMSRAAREYSDGLGAKRVCEELYSDSLPRFREVATIEAVS